MSYFVFRKCCFCVDLRLACFMIAYVMLALRVCSVIMTSVELASEHSSNGIYSIEVQDAAFHRLVNIIGLMIIIFEILLTVALLVGLYKRLDQHLEMYYVGSFAFLIMGVVLGAVVLLRYAERFRAWAWAIVAVEIALKLLFIYFLTVIRSYYYKMKDEVKDDVQRLDGKEPTNYFARTKPMLISNKP